MGAARHEPWRGDQSLPKPVREIAAQSLVSLAQPGAKVDREFKAVEAAKVAAAVIDLDALGSDAQQLRATASRNRVRALDLTLLDAATVATGTSIFEVTAGILS